MRRASLHPHRALPHGEIAGQRAGELGTPCLRRHPLLHERRRLDGRLGDQQHHRGEALRVAVADEARVLAAGDPRGERRVDAPLAGAEALQNVAGEELRVGVAQAVHERKRPDAVGGLHELRDQGVERRGRPAGGSAAISSRVTSAANRAWASGQ